jgi:phosphotransferase system enzyme I (PtsP)
VASEANPVNLSAAQNHPASSYRAETGEEIYHSFLGVPVLRAGNTLGVLVVQNRARRTYTEEEEEALQTTAMVLAEMIASASSPPSPSPAPSRCPPAAHLTGTALNDGIALGHVVLHEPRVVITIYRRRRAEGAQAAGIGGRDHAPDLDVLLERGEVADGGEHRDARGLPHVRLRSRLGAPPGGGGRHRPHRRGRGRARAVGHPRAHAAGDRPLLRERCTTSTSWPTG